MMQLSYVLCIIPMAQVGRSVPPRIVAVTKGRSTNLVREAYNYGIHHFGENYVSTVYSVDRVKINGINVWSR